MWDVPIKFHGYQIDRLRFDPSNPKNLVFQRVGGEKVVFLRILITRSPIPIPFIPTTFYLCVGGVSEGSRPSDLRFTI